MDDGEDGDDDPPPKGPPLGISKAEYAFFSADD